jgi:hypothetical protein
VAELLFMSLATLVAYALWDISLRKGDVVLVEAGDTIPADGEVIDGIASVNEAAITGESAPVIRESGGDRSAVTGGTRVLSEFGDVFLALVVAILLLSVRETEQAIRQIKEFFQTNLAFELNLMRVTAPLFVLGGTGINDDLNGVERPVAFPIKSMQDSRAEIVQSLQEAGYQVILSIGETEENYIGSNCGQYLRRHLMAEAVRRATAASCEVVSSGLDLDKARLDIAAQSSLGPFLSEIEKAANGVIKEDRPVEIKTMQRDQAEKYVARFHESLKTLSPQVQSVRIVEVKDWHACACGGTHVKSFRRDQRGTDFETHVERRGSRTPRVQSKNVLRRAHYLSCLDDEHESQQSTML